MSDDRWIRELDKILYREQAGLQFCDLDDEQQMAFSILAAQQMTPKEAFDEVFG